MRRSGAEMLYILVTAQTGAAFQRVLPAFQVGHAGSIPGIRSEEFYFTGNFRFTIRLRRRLVS
jgi:hypothetical protein